MKLESLKGCKLFIGRYPGFNYNATGGGGSSVKSIHTKDQKEIIYFNPEQFSIPPLYWKTTSFLGLPLPPGIRINVIPNKLICTLDSKGKKLELDFEANFQFSLAGFINAPDLVVKTILNTGTASGEIHSAKGSPIDSKGITKIVGVAKIANTQNIIYNKFLGLPTEALAVLKCKIK